MALPRNFGRWRFENGKNIVSLSSLSQHVTHFPNTAGIHGVLGFCIEPGGVNSLMGSRNEILKAPAISRYLKPESGRLLDCSIPGECLKISEVPLQKISAVPRNFLVIPVHVPGRDKIIAEPTVRQTVWQKLSLYLATFWCQITKQSYK